METESKMEQFNMVQSLSQTNGRVTAKQEIKQLRVNQPSREAPVSYTHLTLPTKRIV